jgi:hypothetical protein
MVELPENHGERKLNHSRKGDWTCVSCGHPNKGM